MSSINLIRTNDFLAWTEILLKSFRYDFYHLPYYHQLAEDRGEGEANLFVYRNNGYIISVPLLLRQINRIPGFEHLPDDILDATSVYGYPGPIYSHKHIPVEIINSFQAALKQVMKDKKIVTVFSRLNPFIDQSHVLEEIGEVLTIGVTVSIDLTQTEEEQLGHYSKGHKNGIKKLINKGVTCVHDEKMEYLDEFFSIYTETMERLGAHKYYFFDKSFFEKFIKNLGTNVEHFICFLDGKAISSGLYVCTKGIIQAYLGGTSGSSSKLAPRKLEKDTVRRWGNITGAQIFHLGGGVGSRMDSLYSFKAGFANTEHEFKIWRWVVDNEMYDNLNEIKLSLNIGHVIKPDSVFFPFYRSN